MKKQDTLEQMFVRRKFEDVELLSYAEWFGFNSHSELEDLKGAKLRKQVAKEILTHPRQVLSCLPLEDLQLLQMLKDAEPGMGMKAYPTSHIMTMAMIGLAEQEEIEDGGMEMISIAEDFKQAIRPHVDAVLDDFNVKFRLYVERIIIGALNLYGVLDENEMKKILKDCMQLEDDGSGVYEHIYAQSILLRLLCLDGSTTQAHDYLISPFVQDFGLSIMEEREKRKETATLKHFDVEDIKEAGNMPIPTFPNPISDKLLNMLETKLGFTEQEAYYWEFMLWRLEQEEDANPIKLFQMLMDASSKSNKLHGVSEVNSVLQVVMDFLNHTHRWAFRGRCPEDLQRSAPPMTSVPQISLGPNAQRMCYKQQDVQQYVNDIWEQRSEPDDFDLVMPYVAHPKVGRNDPCPCGSGKKYKHCCGRGN